MGDLQLDDGDVIVESEVERAVNEGESLMFVVEEGKVESVVNTKSLRMYDTDTTMGAAEA